MYDYLASMPCQGFDGIGCHDPIFVVLDFFGSPINMFIPDYRLATKYNNPMAKSLENKHCLTILTYHEDAGSLEASSCVRKC